MEKEPINTTEIDKAEKPITLEDLRAPLKELLFVIDNEGKIVDILSKDTLVFQPRLPSIYQQPRNKHNSIGEGDYDSTPIDFYI